MLYTVHQFFHLNDFLSHQIYQFPFAASTLNHPTQHKHSLVKLLRNLAFLSFQSFNFLLRVFSSKPGNARQGLNEVQSTTVGSIHLQVEILVTAKVSYSNHPQKVILINPLDCWNFKPIWQILWKFTAKVDGETLDLANWIEVILEAFILPALSANPCLSTRTLSSGAASWRHQWLGENSLDASLVLGASKRCHSCMEFAVQIHHPWGFALKWRRYADQTWPVSQHHLVFPLSKDFTTNHLVHWFMIIPSNDRRLAPIKVRVKAKRWSAIDAATVLQHRTHCHNHLLSFENTGRDDSNCWYSTSSLCSSSKLLMRPATACIAVGWTVAVCDSWARCEKQLNGKTRLESWLHTQFGTSDLGPIFGIPPEQI